MTAPKRRWLWFQLSTLFVVVTLFGIIAWLEAQWRWIGDRHAALKRLTIAHSIAGFDWRSPTQAPFPIRLLGEKGLASVAIWTSSDSEQDRKHVENLKRLFPESRVELHSPH